MVHVLFPWCMYSLLISLTLHSAFLVHFINSTNIVVYACQFNGSGECLAEQYGLRNIPYTGALIPTMRLKYHRSLQFTSNTITIGKRAHIHKAKINQRTNGPVNAHLISGPCIST